MLRISLLCSVSVNEKSFCLICSEGTAVCDEYKIPRSFNSRHKEKWKLYRWSERRKVVNSKRENEAQQKDFRKWSNDRSTALRTLYNVDHLFDTQCKHFFDQEFVRRYFKNTVKVKAGISILNLFACFCFQWTFPFRLLSLHVPSPWSLHVSVPLPRSLQNICPNSRPLVTFRNKMFFHREESLASRPTLKLEDHQLSLGFWDCIFNIFSATLHT